MSSWFMKRFSSVSAYSISGRTLCYFTKYTFYIEPFHLTLSVLESK